MNKSRAVNEEIPMYRNIDTFGNTIDNDGHYYLFVCPVCHKRNLPHAITAGRCYRCDYTLTYKDELPEITQE